MKHSNTITFLSVILFISSLQSELIAEQSAATEELETTEYLETIVITSTRQPSALKELHNNISILEQDTLELISHQHVSQSLSRVPGTWINRGNGQEHLTSIRSPVLTGAGGCGAFFIAQDGISLRAPGFCNINQLFDSNTEQADRIEVIRGPASTLYGSNAVHGVINVVTPNALDANTNTLSIEAGANDYRRGKFNIGTVFEQNALLMLADVATDGGYKDDSGFDQQKFTMIHQFTEGELNIKNVFAITNLNQETAGYVKGFEAYKDAALKKQNPNPEAFRDSKSARLYSLIEYKPDNSSALYITPYARWTNMNFLQHYVPWQPLEENGMKSLGMQAQYNQKIGNINLLAGFDWDFTEGALTETQSSNFSATIPAGYHYDYKVQASVYSPFSQIKWQIVDDFSVNIGIRFDSTNYDYTNKLSNGSACANGVDNCRFMRPKSQKITYDEWSYQLGAQYVIGQKHRVYSQFSTGYRAPQATELFRLQAGQIVADLQAEEIASIELGIRGQWQSLFYDLTVFSMDKEHFIFQNTERQNISDGQTSHKGLEFALRYKFMENFYLSANGSIAEHKYSNNLTLSRTNILNNSIDSAPKHSGSVQIEWHLDSAHRVELEWSHLGAYYLNPENTARYNGHELVNLRGSWQISEQLLLSMGILNLTDKNYAERADFTFGNYQYFVGEPRSIFFTLKWNI